MSSILGNGYLYFIVILLIALESVRILYSPSFLGASTMGITHGLKLSLIEPFFKGFCTHGFLVMHSLLVLFYVQPYLVNLLMELDHVVIDTSYGGNLSGILSDMMSSYFDRNFENSLSTIFSMFVMLHTLGINAKHIFIL